MTTGQKCTIAAERAANIQDFSAALRVHVGADRLITADRLAKLTGISPDTINRLLRGDGGPEWSNALALMYVLPPEFAAAVLRRTGLCGFWRLDDGTAEPGETLAHTAAATAELAGALADGRIDHVEMPRVRAKLARAGAAIWQFLRRGRK